MSYRISRKAEVTYPKQFKHNENIGKSGNRSGKHTVQDNTPRFDSQDLEVLKRWEKQVDMAYRELLDEFQSACDNHVQVISDTLKEMVLHGGFVKKIMKRKRKPEQKDKMGREMNRVSTQKRGLRQEANENPHREDCYDGFSEIGYIDYDPQSETVNDGDTDCSDEEINLFKIKYKENSVLERVWKHREWTSTVWLALGCLFIICILTLMITIVDSVNLTKMRNNTDNILCTFQINDKRCGDLQTKVPTLKEIISGIKINLTEEFQKNVQTMNQQILKIIEKQCYKSSRTNENKVSSKLDMNHHTLLQITGNNQTHISTTNN